jgi:hypothetical protein
VAQLFFGLMSGETKVEPYREGDVLMTKPFGRVVVTHVSENAQGVVLPAVRLDNGAECIVLEREIEYRSRCGNVQL